MGRRYDSHLSRIDEKGTYPILSFDWRSGMKGNLHVPFCSRVRKATFWLRVNKLEPTKEQIAYIEKTLNVCRSVWNFALLKRKDWCKSRSSPVNTCSIDSEYIIAANEPFPNYHRQAKQLTEAKKNNDFLKSANAQVLQQTLRILDRAWDDMKNRGFGFPRFKKQVSNTVICFSSVK